MGGKSLILTLGVVSYSHRDLTLQYEQPYLGDHCSLRRRNADDRGVRLGGTAMIRAVAMYVCMYVVIMILLMTIMMILKIHIISLA